MNTPPLTERQNQIVHGLAAELADSGTLQWHATAEIIAILGLTVDPSGISRDWQALEAAGLVEATGTTKARRYRLDERSEAYLNWDLGRPPELRKAVPYDFNLLRNYEPNVTRWLGDPAQAALHTSVHYQPADVDPESYRRVLNSLIIDLSYASSVLENVKISWLDTKTLIDLGERPKGLSERDMQIVLNHKDAIELMRDAKGDFEINRRDILDLHKKISLNLLGNPADSGRLRRSAVFFDTSRYRPIDNPAVLDEQFNLFCQKAAAVADPHEQAVFAMAFIPYLQPFQDGNKRTSRLAMNIPLINAELPPLSFTTMNKRDYMFGLLAFYERGRVDMLVKAYVSAYQGSAQKYSEMMKFLGDGGTLSTLEIERPRS